MNMTENRELKDEERDEILKKYPAHYWILEEEIEDFKKDKWIWQRRGELKDEESRQIVCTENEREKEDEISLSLSLRGTRKTEMNTTEKRELKDEIFKKYSAHYWILEEEIEDFVEFFFFKSPCLQDIVYYTD